MNGNRPQEATFLHYIAVSEFIIWICKTFFLAIVTAVLCYVWYLIPNLIAIILLEIITLLCYFILWVYFTITLYKYAKVSSSYSKQMSSMHNNEIIQKCKKAPSNSIKIGQGEIYSFSIGWKNDGDILKLTLEPSESFEGIFGVFESKVMNNESTFKLMNRVKTTKTIHIRVTYNGLTVAVMKPVTFLSHIRMI